MAPIYSSTTGLSGDARWLATCAQPAAGFSDAPGFEPCAAQPVGNLLFRVTIFNWGGKAIELVVDTDAKGEAAVLFHRKFFSERFQTRSILQQPVGPHEKPKGCRCCRIRECKDYPMR